MGQLERYGLYVLVVVIALILGVAIIGSDPKEVGAVNTVIAEQQNQQDRWDSPNWDPLGAESRKSALDVPFAELDRRGRGSRTDASDVLRRLDDEADKLDVLFEDDPQVGPRPSDDPGSGPGVVPEPPRDDVVVPQPKPEPQARSIHRVKRGDNAYRIAQKYYGTQGASAVNAIKDANQGVNWSRLQLNAEIVVPEYTPKARAGAANATDNADTVIRHTIRGGDTFSGLARKYLGSESKKNVDAIRALNPGVNEKRLFVGKTVKIPRRNR